MSEDKNKELAPAVVLAQHGNKGAYRDIYIHYYKDIFFMCLSMTGDASSAAKLTAEIFAKMFSSVDKLGDHMAFEQWFYSLAINICRSHINDSGDLIGDRIPELAANASECAVNHDRTGFERNIEKIIPEMILRLPGEARVIFFYSCFASLDNDKIAALEKISAEETEALVEAVYVLLGKQTEKIMEYGISVSMFIDDLPHTLEHLIMKTFVPTSVHDSVSEELGVNVNPFAGVRPQKEAVPEPSKNITAEKPDKEKNAKKNFLTKGDLLLFFAVIAAALLIFSGIKMHNNAQNVKSPSVTASATAADKKKPVVWNGAAASSFASGTGTKEDPYIIENGAELAYLSNLLGDGNSYYASCFYRLGADIILNDTSDFDLWSTRSPANTWRPIGYVNSDDDRCYFTGSFDGNDHVISGMYISADESYAGLFGAVRNGTVKNLIVKDSFVEGGSYTGGIAGYFISDSSSEAGFEYCGFSGIVKSSGSNAGGITGCFRSEGQGNMPSVSCCYSSGTISAELGFAGGIAGVVEADSGSVKIMDCFNAANVSAKNKNCGGITGDLTAADGDAIVIGCYNAGKAESPENAGGISGSAGSAQGEGKVSIISCVMLDSTAPVEAVAVAGDERVVLIDIKKLSEDEMQKSENWEKFSFDEIWTVGNSGGYKYPVLQGIEFIMCSYPEESS